MKLNKKQREKLNDWVNNHLNTALFEDDFDELEKIITAYESFPVELPVILRATEIKLYRPYYCPYYNEKDENYEGEDILFVDKSKAWEYVRTKCCGDCQAIDGGRGSQCEAEWDVVEYDSCESK